MYSYVDQLRLYELNALHTCILYNFMNEAKTHGLLGKQQQKNEYMVIQVNRISKINTPTIGDYILFGNIVRHFENS